MNENTVLLHSCCGPCTLYPLEALRQEGFTVRGYFDNPNIHPFREFEARKEAYRQVAAGEGLETRIGENYGLAAFMAALRDLDAVVYEAKSETRCRACYRMRLEGTAAACKEAGLGLFTTTLLVSPWQHHDLIREMGEELAQDYGLGFLYRDFRPGFRRGQARAREMGLYMQGYCGCIFSEYERYGGSRGGKETIANHGEA